MKSSWNARDVVKCSKQNFNFNRNRNRNFNRKYPLEVKYGI